jgi:tetratricopeptide (TPR) repeat protein
MRTGLLTALLLAAGQVRAADDEALRKKALDLNAVTGDNAINGKIEELVKNPAGTKPILAVAAKMTKEKDQPFNVNATWILARTARDLRAYDEGETFYRLNLSQVKQLGNGEKIVNGYGGLIQVLTDARKYEAAEKACQEFLELNIDDETVDRFKPLVLRRVPLLRVKQGKTDEAIKMVDRLIMAQPENWLNQELKARVLREAGKFDDSIKIYEEIIPKAEKDDRLTEEQRKEFSNDLRYALSGVFIDANKIDKAVEILRVLLKSEPDNPTYNNDLGYIMADHNMNLEESEKLVRKALEEDKKLRKANPKLADRDNPAFLDSLGWVLFKQKKYDEAIKYLKLALEQPEGQHTEIYDHLGDAQLAKGEKAEAVKTWKKAVEVAGDNQREQNKKVEIEKKIKANQ